MPFTDVVELPRPPKLGNWDTEYLLVSDKDSQVLKSSHDYQEVKTLATLIRKAGGEVTVFKSTKG